MIWNDSQVLLVHRMGSVSFLCCHNRMFLVCNVLPEYTRFQGVSVSCDYEQPSSENDIVC